MERLRYQTLEQQGYKGYLLKEAPERVMQFGEGNFLRGFMDCFIDEMNERAGFQGKVVVVQPIPQGQAAQIDAQQGLYAFPHPFGCSQLGADQAQTRRLLAALANHPNAAGVLVVSLGCKNLTLEQFQKELGAWDDRRVKFLTCRDASDEGAEGGRLLAQLAAYGAGFRRETLPVSQPVVGLKCGGSDGLSGITANPCVGWFSDRLIAMGGTAILTEVPEMFGAEQLLLSRCETRAVFDKALDMVESFKEYFRAHGQAVYENPSPGNKAWGITTLEDKSWGCVQKGGSAPVTDVLLWGPGNDLVSATALTAAGAHLILFTTGRGTPFGAPAPTLKIATHTNLYENKPGRMDFDAGPIAQGERVGEAGARLMKAVLLAAGGQPTAASKTVFGKLPSSRMALCSKRGLHCCKPFRPRRVTACRRSRSAHLFCLG